MANNQSNSKRIAKNTLILYFRMIFLMVISLYTSRVVLATLGVNDFGIYNVVGGFVSMFSVLRAGLISATQRFITFELGRGDEKALKSTYSSSMQIYIMISIIIVIAAESLGIWFIQNKMVIPTDRLFAAQWVFQLSLLTLVIGLISNPQNALIIAHEKMGAFAYISIYEAVAKLLIVYVLTIGGMDKLILYAILMCLVQISLRIIYGIYCKRNFEEAKFSFHIDWDRIKKIYGFTGWSMFGGLASIGFTQGLNMLLNVFFNPAINAARGISVQVQNVINHFATNFQTAINPQIIKSYASNELDYMYKLIFASSKFSFYLILFLALPVMMETEQILSLWLKEVPEYASIFFRLMIITTMIDGISNPIMRSVDASGNIRNYQLIVGGILLCIVPIAYIVLKLGGEPYTVFVVHIIMGLIAFAMRLRLANRLTGIPLGEYVNKVLVKVLLVFQANVNFCITA